MVGVFVAFIRVVYGRMIYMSLPIYTGILFKCSCISWILGPSVLYVHVHIKTFFFYFQLSSDNLSC